MESIDRFSKKNQPDQQLTEAYIRRSEYGKTIYLKDITWKSDEDLIFSNHPVRSVNGQRITYGDGFVSDQRLENLHITRQRGIIEFQE